MATATTTNRSWYKRNEIAVTPWLFLLPGVVFFALYVIFPIFQSVNVYWAVIVNSKPRSGTTSNGSCFICWPSRWD